MNHPHFQSYKAAQHEVGRSQLRDGVAKLMVKPAVMPRSHGRILKVGE